MSDQWRNPPIQMKFSQRRDEHLKDQPPGRMDSHEGIFTYFNSITPLYLEPEVLDDLDPIIERSRWEQCRKRQLSVSDNLIHSSHQSLSLRAPSRKIIRQSVNARLLLKHLQQVIVSLAQQTDLHADRALLLHWSVEVNVSLSF
jgi:hypothetical protein